MTPKMKRERKRASATAIALRNSWANEEHISREIANASGVLASQLTQYAEGKVSDADGDFFHSQEALQMFRRMQMPDASSSDDSSCED